MVLPFATFLLLLLFFFMWPANKIKIVIIKKKFRFISQLKGPTLVAHMTSTISSHVKMLPLFSHVKISCFHSARNPDNSLKFIYK